MRSRKQRANRRNPFALAARRRPAGPMKHRRSGRGGARNLQRESLTEWADERARIKEVANE